MCFGLYCDRMGWFFDWKYENIEHICEHCLDLVAFPENCRLLITCY